MCLKGKTVHAREHDARIRSVQALDVATGPLAAPPTRSEATAPPAHPRAVPLGEGAPAGDAAARRRGDTQPAGIGVPESGAAHGGPGKERSLRLGTAVWCWQLTWSSPPRSVTLRCVCQSYHVRWCHPSSDTFLLGEA